MRVLQKTLFKMKGPPVPNFKNNSKLQKDHIPFLIFLWDSNRRSKTIVRKQN